MSLSGLSKHTLESNRFKLVADKLEEWEWMNRFIESNSDIKERYERHKTFEILNNDRLSQR